MRNVGSIINEEVQKLLNEADFVRDNRLKFVQDVNATFENYESFSSDYDTKIIGNSKIRVYWGVSFWVNPEGINKFNVEVDKVEGFYLLQYLDKQSDEVVQETQKNIAETDWHFQVEEAKIEYGGHLYLMELEFDFKDNVCTAIF
jgi:hypothetical protein